ncbi:MAG TPA: hypothetical protein PK906_06515 [Spirochaetota bacterium]|nr:hypothetical protein [Spirochaetota bacterium]
MKLKFFFLPMLLVLPLIFSLKAPSHARTGNNIAVVKSRYDNIELVLSNYHIPYDLINFRDLADKNIFSKYNSIFFPSGIESNYEDNISVKWHGKQISSVKLAKDYFELDEAVFGNNLKNFIKNGGSAYFSGYAYKQMSTAYDNFKFFEDFPFMGIPGRIEANVYDDLAMFSMKGKSFLYMEYPGWIALKDVSNAQVLSESRFETPKGEKSGPISVLLKDGQGEIIYTSYYSTVYSEFKRFNIYRIAGNRVLKKGVELADDHFQKAKGKIIDSFLGWETSRKYYFNIEVGTNTFYFHSDGVPFMYEIYDSDNSLIISREIYEKSQNYTMKSTKRGFCYIKVYPGGKERWKMYSIVSARGAQISPRILKTGKYILYGIAILFLAAFIKVAISRLK